MWSQVCTNTNLAHVVGVVVELDVGEVVSVEVSDVVRELVTDVVKVNVRVLVPEVDAVVLGVVR